MECIDVAIIFAAFSAFVGLNFYWSYSWDRAQKRLDDEYKAECDAVDRRNEQIRKERIKTGKRGRPLETYPPKPILR